MSPVGGSTLMTSAPKSDRITAALGPAMKLAKSTTFSPEKILSFMVCLVRLSKGRARSGPFWSLAWKFGLRFSRNAATPSFMSSVAKHWAKSDASMFSPSARLTSRPRFAASIASLTAIGALALILFRMASARGMRLSLATISLTKPIR